MNMAVQELKEYMADRLVIFATISATANTWIGSATGQFLVQCAGLASALLTMIWILMRIYHSLKDDKRKARAEQRAQEKHALEMSGALRNRRSTD